MRTEGELRHDAAQTTGTDLRDMLSTPAATPSDISPARMLCAIFLIAISPEEQSRLTVEIGTLSGIPAASAAARETYKGEGGWQVPSQLHHHTHAIYCKKVKHISIPTQMSSIDAGFNFVFSKVVCV